MISEGHIRVGMRGMGSHGDDFYTVGISSADFLEFQVTARRGGGGGSAMSSGLGPAFAAVAEVSIAQLSTATS